MELKDLNLLSFGNTVNLAGAVYLGEGRVLLAMFPEYKGSIGQDVFTESKGTENLDVSTLNLTREDWSALMRQTDIMETEILQAAGEDGKLVKAVLRKSQRQISQDVSWRVYRRDGFQCRYCGAEDCPLTVDHLVLWEEGGPSEETNLVAACKKCNNRRGNTPYAEWLQDPYYLRVSENLPAEVRQANADLIRTLDEIPRLKHKRSSR